MLAGVAHSLEGNCTSISTDVIEPEQRVSESESDSPSHASAPKESHYKFGIIQTMQPDSDREIKYVIIRKTVRSYEQVKDIVNNAFGKEHKDRSVLKRETARAEPRDREPKEHGG